MALASRPAKRARVVPSRAEGGSSTPSSRLFAPFRTVGLVSPTDVPFTTVGLGKTTFQITTSVGHALQTYDLRRGLQLTFISRPETPGVITATAAWGDKVLAAWQTEGREIGVSVYQRGKLVGILEPTARKDGGRPITRLIVFGRWIVGLSAAAIDVWTAAEGKTRPSGDVSTAMGKHYSSLASPYAVNGAPYSGAVCTLPTYLNKIFVGRTDGGVEIWNVSTAKLVYTILPPDAGWGAVTAVAAAPSVSLMAIAFQAGPVVVQNVRTDEPVVVVGSVGGLAVSTISFRTDGLGAGDDGQLSGVMATVCRDHTDVTFWDLNQGGKRAGVFRNAHSIGVTGLEFLSGQAVLVTSGRDNSLRTWIFDDSPFSPVPRQLHIRAGHAAGLSTVAFLPVDTESSDSTGKWLLSAGQDRAFWGWSLRRDGQSGEVSQGPGRSSKKGVLGDDENSRMPPVTAMACSLNRDGGMGAAPAGGKAVWVNPRKTKTRGTTADTSLTGWESVVTAHQADRFARTWFWGRRRAGRWMLETSDRRDVTAVAMSACGTFAIVGSAGGSIDCWNLQSGRLRSRFPKKGGGGHTAAVVGLVVDPVNRMMYSSSADGVVNVWDFYKGEKTDEMGWPDDLVGGLKSHAGASLLAVRIDRPDHSFIRLIDPVSKRTVRRFVASARLNDFCFSHDGRWVVGAGCDDGIRVWDMPTGQLVDAFRLRNECLSVAFSPSGDFLATVGGDCVGVDLWASRTLFTHVSLRPVDEAAALSRPAIGTTVSGEGGLGVVDAMFEDDDDEDGCVDGVPLPTVDQLADDLVTLSTVPRARWTTVLHLDSIRARNAPTEAPSKPEKAPFFLPSAGSGIEGDEGGAAAVMKLANTPGGSRIGTGLTSGSAIVRSAGSGPSFQSVLDRVIVDPTDDGSISDFVSHLGSLSPSAADLAIRTLSVTRPYDELIAFVRAITHRARSGRDFELCVVWMRVFIRIHSQVLTEAGSKVGEVLRHWQDVVALHTGRLDERVGFCAGVGAWIQSGL